MNRTALKKIPLRAVPFPGWGQKVHRWIFALFLLQFVLVWLSLSAPWPNFGNARWPDGLLVVLAAATTVASLTRQLPTQNVLLASAVIVLIAGAVHTLSALCGIPFGPCRYTKRVGQVLFEPLPWAVPLVWLIALLNARGVGRLILRPWRKARNYGFWLMGVTAFLVVLFDFGLEPFATQVKHFWEWGPSRAGLYWYTTPWVNFVGWMVTALLILAFATPSLINKKPVKHPPDYHPLVVWGLVDLLMVTGAVTKQLWGAAGVQSAVTAVVVTLAIRGAPWFDRSPP
jgi:uncharacterized membrane protein